MEKEQALVVTTAQKSIDPEILKLRAKAKAEVAEYRKGQKSAEILKRIVDKELPRMTHQDVQSLRGATLALIEKGNVPKATP